MISSGFIKRATLLFLAGLLIRLAVLPFSSTTEPDAGVRVLIAERWLQHPQSAPHDAWLPLHFILIAVSLLAGKDVVLSPILLNIVFSVATSVVLYAFVRREWEESAGLFVAVAWLFYPVALHYSLMAVSEIPFAFLISLAMLELSKARESSAGWKEAFWAGSWLTLAGAIRFEAWVLIPILGTVLLRRLKPLFVFLAASSVFPLIWMLRSYILFGDALYSLHSIANWAINMEGYNDAVTFHKSLKRACYYPQVLFFGLTPVVGGMCIAGAVRLCVKRQKQAVWLIPFAVMAAVFFVNAVKPSVLMMIPRYSILLGLLFLPFAAECYTAAVSKLRHPLMASILIIGSMIPFSYVRHVNVHVVSMAVPAELEAIPRIGPRAQSISRLLNKQLESVSGGGLVLDWWNWSETSYVALMTKVAPERIYVLPGGKHQTLDAKGLAAFLKSNPSGVMLMAPTSRFAEIALEDGVSTLRFPGCGKILRADRTSALEGFTMYRYETLEP